MRIARRKGIGMTEAIIAMAIIVIVSVSAMGLVTRFANNSAQIMMNNNAINLADNALECFKFSTSRQQFVGHMYRTLSINDWPQAEDGVLYTYTGYTDVIVIIKVEFFPTSHYALFSATVKNSKNRVVYSIVNYEKYLPEQ